MQIYKKFGGLEAAYSLKLSQGLAANWILNRLPEKKSKSLLELAWLAYNDKVLILLTIAAVVSLALGLYQTFGTPHEPGEPKVEWVEGVAIIVAILIVVIVYVNPDRSRSYRAHPSGFGIQ